MNQQQLLDELEKLTEQHLIDAIGIFQNLNEQQLSNPAANGGWSIAQCLWHLNSYGWYYLPLIKKSLQVAPDKPTSPMFKPGLLGNYFTRLMQPKADTKKMKAPTNHTPLKIENPYAVVADFIMQQENLLTYIRLARNKNLQNSNIPTSIFRLIKLNTGDALRFVIAHTERHIIQAKRNLTML
ncbi:MAG TPA: DinB family protein [Chitinophagales bacterium]|nr:DinB family protein [Chitinophagales bacterium]